MGLPIFITPTEPEVTAKATEKVTSGPRSSIRRQRTIRGGPHARLSAESRRRRMLGLLAHSDTNTLEYEVWESQQRSPPDELEPTTVASIQDRARRMFENEQIRSADPLSFERRHPPDTEVDGPLMPPVPESRDFSTFEPSFDDRQREIERLHQVRRDLRRMARMRPAPTPPYTETDIAFMARMGRESPRPAFASIHSPQHQSPPAEETEPSRARSILDTSGFTVHRIDGNSSPYHTADQPQLGMSSLSERVRAFNRASSSMERSRRAIRQARLDGLGDRDRSLSPERGSAWDTLLTSITPDPQPPSAGSSFASTSAAAAATASSSSNVGPTSASTSMTSLDRTGEPPTVPDCDVSDSGSNTEDDEEDMYELQDFNRTRGERFWRSSYADVARASRIGQSSDTELGGMHRIISRLAERDDIPESWWASVGLRREPTA